MKLIQVAALYNNSFCFSAIEVLLHDDMTLRVINALNHTNKLERSPIVSELLASLLLKNEREFIRNVNAEIPAFYPLSSM